MHVWLNSCKLWQQKYHSKPCFPAPFLQTLPELAALLKGYSSLRICLPRSCAVSGIQNVCKKPQYYYQDCGSRKWGVTLFLPVKTMLVDWLPNWTRALWSIRPSSTAWSHMTLIWWSKKVIVHASYDHHHHPNCNKSNTINLHTRKLFLQNRMSENFTHHRRTCQWLLMALWMGFKPFSCIASPNLEVMKETRMRNRAAQVKATKGTMLCWSRQCFIPAKPSAMKK